MRCYQTGVSLSSDYYFYTPSTLAREILLYELCLGQFYCTQGYEIVRDFHNSLLLVGMVDGALSVSSQERSAIARAGDIIVMDCRQPHRYAAVGHANFVFVHLDGAAALGYYQAVMSTRGLVFHHEQFAHFYEDMQDLLAPFRAGTIPRETDAHLLLTRLWCSLLTSPGMSGGATTHDGPVGDALAYVREHLSDDLNLARLAAIVNMSPFHFSRQFKSQTGYSPYEFIINSRIDSAKHLLKQSDLSIREVAYSVGFNSESNFIHTFRQRVGQTPNQFRQTQY